MTTSIARLSLACALALSLSAAFAQAGTAVAKITRVKGQAEVSSDGQNWKPATAGTEISAGSSLRTGEGGQIDVLLSQSRVVSTTEPVVGSLIYFPESGSEQANMVRLLDNTTLAIDTLTETRTGMNAVSETQLNLTKGSIFFSVKKLSAGSNFEIKCPKGIAGVRGTLGWMNADGVIRLLRGMLAETYRAADGTTRTQVIHARQMFDPSTGLLQAIDDQTFRDLLRIAIEIIRFAGAPALPATFILDPNVLVTSPVNEGISFDDGYGSGGGDGE
jgi:ferric-dicitrate binding protein FerR (iron transport regulator)